MKLGGEDRSSLHGRHEGALVVGSGDPPARGRLLQTEGVGKEDVTAPQMAAPGFGFDRVPPEVRATHVGPKSDECAVVDPEPGRPGGFLAGGPEELKAQTNRQKGLSRFHVGSDGPIETSGSQDLHGRRKGPDAGKHQPVGPRGGLTVFDPLDRGPESLEAPGDRSDVGDPRRDQTHLHTKTPFVLATPPSRSSTAMDSPIPTALKAPSQR